MASPPHPTLATVATLCYKGTGQTLALLPGATIVLGRGTIAGIVSPHVSRKQVEVIASASSVFEVTAIRRGSNRSFLNDKELAKDVPTVVHDGDTITLLEQDKFPITFDIKQPDIVPGTRKGSTSQSSVKALRTQESLPPISSPATSVPKSLVDNLTPITTTTTTAATTHTPVADNKTEKDFRKHVRESAAETGKMDLDEEISENTSESEEEDLPAPHGAAGSASRVSSSAHSAGLEMDDDYVSDESSFVCEDLSDLETHGTSHDPQMIDVQSD